MSTVEPAVPGLQPGERMTREEFLRRWEALPGLKRAELIRGVVHMPSPVSLEHSALDGLLSGWLFVYASQTAGCQVLPNATWLMSEEDAPQPDVALRLRAEWGGQSRQEGRYAAGAPELAAETALSSAARDLGDKLALYDAAGVREYVVVLVGEADVRWYRRVAERLELVRRPADGVYRSAVFPGLWLDAGALLAGDATGLLDVLRRGMASAEYAEFLVRLAARRTS